MTNASNPTSEAGYDAGLLFPVLLLTGIGIAMVYSASSALALKNFGSDYYFLKRQALFALLGLVTLVVCRHVPYTWLRPLAYPILFTAAALLAALHIPTIGHTAGGSTRWLHLGGISFQPSEFARFALIVFMAYSLNKKSDRLREFNIGFLPHLIIVAIFGYLILMEPDFGSVVILGSIAWLIMFAAGVRLFHLLSPLVVLAPALAYMIWGSSYRWDRIRGFLDPWKYSTSEGYQLIHSLMAFGTGGVWGTGLGKGYQKLHYLPEPHTDFIFSVIAEESGLIGVMVILILYGLILYRGIHIARHAQDTFGALLAFGLTSAIVLQAGVNMGVALGLLPTKGLTLPFLSYGGTSLLLNMASVGILMNVGHIKQLRQN